MPAAPSRSTHWLPGVFRSPAHSSAQSAAVLPPPATRQYPSQDPRRAPAISAHLPR